jgi:ADP-heptose:LPS heptosyltransferase
MRILVVRACGIGDFVLNLPALRALAEQHPSARFTLVGYPATLELAKTFVPVEAVYSIELRPWAELFQGCLPGLSRFDAAWVWMKDATVAQNLRASGIPSVFHFDPFPVQGHAAAHLVESTGLTAPDLPDLWRPGSARILLHPGSGGAAKVWPHFEELAGGLPEALVIRGPCEASFRSPHAKVDNLPLPDLADALCDCRLFIGNDSGITHLAAYWGAPTAALFGPTDPQVWGPVGRRVEILRKESLADISVEDVRKLL